MDDGMLAGDDSVDLSDEIAKLRLRKQELLRVQNDQVGVPTDNVVGLEHGRGQINC